MQQNAKEVGKYFLKSLAQLRDTYDIVGDVRGQVRLYHIYMYIDFSLEINIIKFI